MSGIYVSPPRPRGANPNKGAARTKWLALWSGAEPGHTQGPWTQSLTLERWRLKSKRTRSPANSNQPPDPIHHFLICPNCQRKKRKLFMVLAHEQEVNDAEFAEGWIKMLDALPLSLSKGEGRGEGSQLGKHSVWELRAQLIDRYGLLFRDRKLLCIKCMGIRWGEVRKSRRSRTIV